MRIIPTHELALPSLPPPLAIGEIGEITVRGRVVSEIYWRNRDANDMHKIADGMTVWHRMGDLGYFDADGLLWFCGRKSQRVRTQAEPCTQPAAKKYSTAIPQFVARPWSA